MTKDEVPPGDQHGVSARRRVAGAFAVGTAAGLLALVWLSWAVAGLVGWDVAALTYVSSIWLTVWRFDTPNGADEAVSTVELLARQDLITVHDGATVAWEPGARKQPPTPTMKAVWSKYPPTTEERASVVAFLAQAGVSQRPAEAIWQLAGLAALGVVILLAIAGLNWRNRLRFGVRRPMMAKPTTGHTDPRNGGWFTGPYHPGWRSQFRSER